MNSKTADTKSVSKPQELCIDLPGETVRCWRSGDRVKIILRKHRDVFFDINLRKGAIYTIESKSDFYSPSDKKIFKTMLIRDGEQLHIWVGRNFKDAFILKSEGKTIGVFEPSKLDNMAYNADPKTKPEPLMVILGKKDMSFPPVHPAEDRFWLSSAQGLFKPIFDPKISLLKNFGGTYDCRFTPQEAEISEYVCVAEAVGTEIRPHVLKQLESGAAEGNINELFLPPKAGQPPSGLYQAIALTVESITGSQVLTSNIFKEGVGYMQENLKELNKVTMRARIEKRAVGKYVVVFKGIPLTKRIGQALGVAKNAKVVHETVSLGSAKSAFIDGGFGRTGRSGYGGFKRIALTTSKNFRGGLNMQGIGTVIDITEDVQDVYFSENGSKDLSELLGRSGVSLLKGGATAAVGGVFAAVLIGFVSCVLGITVLPVAVTALLVIGGYLAAATIIDNLDEKFNIKDTVAGLVK